MEAKWVTKWKKTTKKHTQKSFPKIIEKNIQNGVQNPSKSVPGGVLGGSWGHLGSKLWFGVILAPTLGGLGPILAPSCGFWAPSWFPNGGQNPWKLFPRAIQKVIIFWSFFGSTFGAIWCQLGSQPPPKTFPKWSQVGSKIGTSWGVDLRDVFWWMLDRFLLIFDLNMPRAKWLKSIKNVEPSPNLVFFDTLVVVLLGWLFDSFLIDFWWIWMLKIYQKSIQKVIKNKMRFWMHLGWLLERFWLDFGSKLGGKTKPNWHPNPT